MTKKKAKKKAQKKRSLFDEISAGFSDLRAQREGTLTLRERTVQPLVLPSVDARFIVDLRERLHMSRTVFAFKLGFSPRSLEGWEQGTKRPPDAVAALLLLTARFPDTLERLASLQAAPPKTAARLAV